MYRFIPLAALLFAGAVLGQQVDVSGKDFLSGAGDAKLASIAQQAAAAGKSLEVTAPDYWQAKVAAKLHASAADVAIKSNNGFFENVLVKVVDAAQAKPVAASPDAQAVKATAEKVAAQKAAEEKAAQEKAVAEQAAAQRAAAQAAAAKAAADKAAAEKAAAQKAAADKAAAEKAATEKAAAEKVAAEKAAADKLAAARRNMEKNFNGGRQTADTLEVGQLQTDDVIQVDGNVRGVVRRGNSRWQFYWLQGDLNLDRVELLPSGDGSYKVLRAINMSAAPVLRASDAGAALSSGEGTFAAAVPTDGSAARKSLQDQYAGGLTVADSLGPSDLRQDDIIYTGQGAAIVVRRINGRFVRYWLDGSLDLGQTGLRNQGGNAYKVLSDTIR